MANVLSKIKQGFQDVVVNPIRFGAATAQNQILGPDTAAGQAVLVGPNSGAPQTVRNAIGRKQMMDLIGLAKQLGLDHPYVQQQAQGFKAQFMGGATAPGSMEIPAYGPMSPRDEAETNRIKVETELSKGKLGTQEMDAWTEQAYRLGRILDSINPEDYPEDYKNAQAALGQVLGKINGLKQQPNTSQQPASAALSGIQPSPNVQSQPIGRRQRNPIYTPFPVPVVDTTIPSRSAFGLPTTPTQRPSTATPGIIADQRANAMAQAPAVPQATAPQQAMQQPVQQQRQPWAATQLLTKYPLTSTYLKQLPSEQQTAILQAIQQRPDLTDEQLSAIVQKYITE